METDDSNRTGEEEGLPSKEPFRDSSCVTVKESLDRGGNVKKGDSSLTGKKMSEDSIKGFREEVEIEDVRGSSSKGVIFGLMDESVWEAK